MQFCEYRSIYDSMKGWVPELVTERRSDFYKKILGVKGSNTESLFEFLLSRSGITNPQKAASLTSVIVTHTLIEWEWVEVGQPYFKVMPEVLNRCRSVPVSRIEGHQVQMPFDLPAVSINLPSPEDGNPLVVNDDLWIRSILAYSPKQCRVDRLFEQFDNQLMPKPFYDTQQDDKHRIMLFLDSGDEEEEERKSSIFDDLCSDDDMSSGMSFRKNRKSRKERRRKKRISPKWSYTNVTYNSQQTMDKAIASQKIDEASIPQWLYVESIKILLGVCGLVQQADPHVIPDVFSKDRGKLNEAIREGNYLKIYELQERAKRRGTFGWLVGKTEH